MCFFTGKIYKDNDNISLCEQTNFSKYYSIMSTSELLFHLPSERIFKVIVIGEPTVDKTSLLRTFCGEKFEYNYISTVGVNITKEKVTFKDDMGKDTGVSLMIWDIAGQPQFNMLHRPYFNGADGIILVFDIMRTSTFNNMNDWWQSCIKYGISDVPRILVGIKKSMTDERKITLDMARHLSEELNAPYFEVSALTGKNVKLIFHKIAELIYYYYMKSILI